MQKHQLLTSESGCLVNYSKYRFYLLISLTAMMALFSYVANAEDRYIITFDESMTSEVTVQVYTGLQSLEPLSASLRQHRYYGYNVDIKTSINGVSDQTINLTGPGDWTTNFGTLDFRPNLNFCEGSTTYNCDRFTFTPNLSAISSQPANTVIKVTIDFFHKSGGVVQFSHTADIYFEKKDLGFKWRSNTTAMETNQTPENDSVNLHYADANAEFDSISELSFELWAQEGSETVRKFTLNRSEVYSSWAGEEWHYRTDYGSWYVQSYSNCAGQTDGLKCSQVLFQPDEAAINSLYGKNVTMWLRGTKTKDNITQTAILKFNINGYPILTAELQNQDSESIETADQLVSNDILGTGSVFKRKVSSVSINVTENINQNHQPVIGNIGNVSSINSFMAKQFGTNFVYGSWYVEENYTKQDDPHNDLFHSGTIRFLYRANLTEVRNAFNRNSFITTTLNLNLHQGDDSSPIIQAQFITITINPAAKRPTLSITQYTNSVIEGSPIVLTITSDFNPERPLNLALTPTNIMGDYLDPATSLTGVSKIETLTLQQLEGSEEWTDEISIDLRDADGKHGENGSISVILDAISDFTPYVVAKEPHNSATIMVENTEKPALSFVENSVTISEDDIDKNMQLVLNLSESIEEAVNITYSIVAETATGGDDFVDFSNGSVSILPNTTSIPINIQIKGDELSESNETFKVVISTPPSNAYFLHGVPSLEADVTIHDDEPIIMNVATTDFNVAEDVVNGNFIVEVVLTKNTVIANPNDQTPDSVSFLVETSSGTATIDADFKTPDRLPTAPRFNIPADAKTFSFAIPILNDVENEGNETFNLRIHDLQQATFADGTTEHSLELTIIDNEKPTLSFMQDTKTVEEEDSEPNVELTLNLSGPIEEAVNISYELISESATVGTDFVDNGTGVVTIAANTTSIPISIQIKGDIINEGDETFKVRVTTPPNNAAFANGVSMLEATITIVDDESPTLSIDSSTLTISELAEMIHVGLVLSGPTNEDVVVTYSTSITGNDTAQQADFTAQIASTTTIAASPPPATPSTFGLIQIPITNDTDEEEDETFTLTLTGISGAVFAGDKSSIEEQVTIIDDEGLPILSIDSDQIAVNEQSGYAEIDLSFAPVITEPVTIVYSTIQDTAVGGNDYTIQTNATLEIATGSTETIFIPITNDNIYEGDEEFSIEISAISGVAYGSGVLNTPITVTITDDETEPTLTISAYSCDYGEPIPTNFSVNESVGNLIFNAKLSHPSQDPVTFNYSATVDTQIRDDSATSADFYVSSATQYTIQPGSICIEIVTPITHDELVEENEQFNVTFASDTGTNIIPSFKVKIEDDDIAIWNIEDLAMNEGNSNTEMAFRVYLSAPVHETVRIKWTASTVIGNTATFGEDYAPSHNSYTGYVIILAGKIENFISGLETTGDTIFEPDETFTITLSSPEAGTQIGDGLAVGTIINDDPEPTLSISTISQVNGN